MQVASRKPPEGQKRGWLKVVVLILAWLIIISLARDVWKIRSGFNRITESQTRLEVEEVRNAGLKEKLGLVMTESYKEKLIREKLNMQREGEVLIVMPKKEGVGTNESGETEFVEPNWEKWWNLLK